MKMEKDLLIKSEKELDDQFEKLIKERKSPTPLMQTIIQETKVLEFDDHSSISSNEANNNLVEESFISELKDIYNTDLSNNFGNVLENNNSFSFFNLKKPIGEVFQTLPKFLDFKKNEEEKFLVDYNEKVFNVF